MKALKKTDGYVEAIDFDVKRGQVKSMEAQQSGGLVRASTLGWPYICKGSIGKAYIGKAYIGKAYNDKAYIGKVQKSKYIATRVCSVADFLNLTFQRSQARIPRA